MSGRKRTTIRGKEEKRETASVESFTLSDYWSSNREKNAFRPTNHGPEMKAALATAGAHAAYMCAAS